MEQHTLNKQLFFPFSIQQLPYIVGHYILFRFILNQSFCQPTPQKQTKPVKPRFIISLSPLPFYSVSMKFTGRMRTDYLRGTKTNLALGSYSTCFYFIFISYEMNAAFSSRVFSRLYPYLIRTTLEITKELNNH